MEWMRRVSLVRRVRFAVGGVAVAAAALGFGAASALSGPAAMVVQACTVGLCAFAAVVAWLVSASIKQTVEDTIGCVTRIAGGDLETKIESPGRDEISWLRSELNGMRKKLRTMVIEVRDTAHSVAAASDQIASGNADLSQRTERQASSLQETASSMQQLAGSVRHNADNSMQARTVVTQSSEVAERGAETMREVVATMNEIHASASRIGEIVGVIDGIAFQTNILALNAAVEAARAGEHGRGFAVVASEVRTLAQRSSTAAREIKTLISDSSARVETGSKLVNAAGDTMQEIRDSIQRAVSLIAEIAQSGTLQGEGIGGVSSAVTQIDTMTQQNAALVEELAAAAQSLRGQSSRLSSAIGSFRVAG